MGTELATNSNCSLDVSVCKFVIFVYLLRQAVDYPQRRYRIVLRSTMGPIDVYLVRYRCLLLLTRLLILLAAKLLLRRSYPGGDGTNDDCSYN